jgi:hypothetical protein
MSGIKNRYNLIFKWPQDSPHSGYDIISIKSVASTDNTLIYHTIDNRINTTGDRGCTDNTVKAIRCSKEYKQEMEILASVEGNCDKNDERFEINYFRIETFKSSNFISVIKPNRGNIYSVKYRGTKNNNTRDLYGSRSFGLKIDNYIIDYNNQEWSLSDGYDKINVTKKTIGSVEYLNIVSEKSITNVEIVDRI